MQLKQLHKLDPLTSHDSSGESVTILSDIFGIDNQHLSDWVRPGDKEKEDTAKPNAVVIHYDRGVEVNIYIVIPNMLIQDKISVCLAR